jgi:hypothetical protein
MTDVYSNYLRPIFTNNLIKTLQDGTSINLIAQDGQGRRRLLEDMEKSNLRNTKIILVDMKHYKENYDGFIQALWQPFEKKGEEPTNLGQLITKLGEKINERIIIVLHHFDDLLDNLQIDNQFNIAFFNELNNIRNQAKLSLLCVTSQPHEHSMVFINEKPYRRSWLDLEKKRLPKLTYEEILFELKYRDFLLSIDELSQVAWAAHNHVKPYSLLNFFANKIATQEDKSTDIKKRLQMWTEQFQQEREQFFSDDKPHRI